MAGIPNPCLQNQSDEVPTSQAQTLPPVPFPNSALPDDLQRVGAAPNDDSQTFAASSRQPYRQDWRSIGIHELLNPAEDKPRSNASHDLSLPSRSNACSLSLARPSPYRPVGQDTPYPQAQSRESTSGINPEAPQLASQGDSPSTQYPSNSRISQTDSVIATPVMSTGQPQYYSSSPSSDPTSTLPQMPLGTKSFEMPTTSTAAQIQYRMMVPEKARAPLQVSMDVQVASKVQDEKRKRNATASVRSRQRRREQDTKTIADLKAQLRDAVEENNHYRQERNKLLDEVNGYRLHMASRSPAPWRRQEATMCIAPLVRYQEAGGSGRTSGL